MPFRREMFAPGEYYHLYNRGTDKRDIFLNDRDKHRFVRLLFLCNSDKPVIYREVENIPLSEIQRGKTLVSIGAYCLMKNHFHLLVREDVDGGIVIFMHKLLTAYSTYFNIKYERSGALFGSRFKSSHLNTDQYLKYMFSYIHLNPLKIMDKNWRDKKLDPKKVKNYLERYSYSSYNEYIGVKRNENLILDRMAFPSYFEKTEDFEEEICSWFLKYDPHSNT